MEYSTFSYKDAHYRYTAANPAAVRAEIKRRRNELEAYIDRYPLFKTALEPVPPRDDAPPIARVMHRAAELAGVGPMAAVAGAIAEAAARAGAAGADEGAVVENGGDIFLWMKTDVVVGLFAGESPVSGRIGFAVAPDLMPLAVCSSSGTMGHSLSFGRADLATVVAPDGALADAAATLAGNLVKGAEDIEDALNRVCGIPGVMGALIVVGDRIGLKGTLPPLVKIGDREFTAKITRDGRSGFSPHSGIT